MVNMADVAEEAGVSTATVSHVINETRFVREETKQKVYRAMGKLNYHPNSAARSLRSQRSNTIGFIAPDISNPFYMSLIKGVENYLRAQGYNFLVSNSDDSLEIERNQLKIFNAQLIDGLIMRATFEDHSFLNDYIEDIPTVFIDCKPSNYRGGDSVLVENKQGAYQAVDLFLRSEHEKIGMIAGIPELTSTEERISGYIQALKEHQITVDRSLIKTGNSRADSGYKLARELVDNHGITAIFAGNNLITIGALKYLKEHQLQVPGDIAIIGFDDREWFSITSPSLTSIRQPAYKMGTRAAEILIERIKNKNQEQYREYRLPVELIERESHFYRGD
ncbi:MAG: LacI family DNA-binding transcriptional regulator [Bacillota bacterium]